MFAAYVTLRYANRRRVIVFDNAVHRTRVTLESNNKYALVYTRLNRESVYVTQVLSSMQ